MKAYILFVFIFLCNCIHGQKIEKFYDLNWKQCEAGDASYYSLVEKTDSGWYQKDYYVQARSLQMTGLFLDSSGKKQNGQFVYYYPNGQISQAGKYLNGKKEGLWHSFHRNGQMSELIFYKDGDKTGTQLSWSDEGVLTDSTVLNKAGEGASVYWHPNGTLSAMGSYSKSRQQDGRWVYYHQNGKKSSVENYENGKLISRQYYDENGFSISDTANTEKDAFFSNSLWSQYLTTRLRMPPGYKIENSNKAIIVVDFIIGTDGRVENSYISMTFHPEFDKVALEIIQNSPKWTPAIDKHNRKVRAYRRQPITFKQINVD